MKPKNILFSITLCALGALALTQSALAQEGGWPLQVQNLSLPSIIPVANSPTNFATPIAIDMGKLKVAVPQFSVSSKDATSTTNVTFLGAWSATGTLADADTNNSVVVTANMLAGKPCVTCTNVLTGNGRRYFILWQENIAANSQVTNNSAKYDTTVSPY